MASVVINTYQIQIQADAAVDEDGEEGEMHRAESVEVAAAYLRAYPDGVCWIVNVQEWCCAGKCAGMVLCTSNVFRIQGGPCA